MREILNLILVPFLEPISQPYSRWAQFLPIFILRCKKIMRLLRSSEVISASFSIDLVHAPMLNPFSPL